MGCGKVAIDSMRWGMAGIDVVSAIGKVAIASGYCDHLHPEDVE